jgi:membrane protein DedA with SNARE-associated domain
MSLLSKGEKSMRGTLILIVFFLMFTVASLLVPCPMFPGNVLCSTIGMVTKQYSEYLSAVFNGVFYGIILWLVFVAFSRRLEEDT